MQTYASRKMSETHLDVLGDILRHCCLLVNMPATLQRERDSVTVVL